MDQRNSKPVLLGWAAVMIAAIFAIGLMAYLKRSSPGKQPRGRSDISARALENTYNQIADGMNRITVSIYTGNSGAAKPLLLGSGIMIYDQYVLTDYHVVQNAADLSVTLYSPTAVTYPAAVVLADRAEDIAVMSVAANTAFPSANLGNSDNVNIGDMVFAMGNAFGAGNVFTTGVICDNNRSFVAGGGNYRNMIQTENPVYPGASGGPLTDINGSVIGINTAISDPQGQFTGIGFATPINRVLALLQNSGLTALNGSAPNSAAVYNAGGATAYTAAA